MAGNDLDDFELERTSQAADEATRRSPLGVPPDREPSASRLFPLTLVAVALVALGVLVVLYLVFRQPGPAKPIPGAAAGPVPTSLPAPTEPPAAPAIPLPALETSDEYVRRLAAGLSAHPELARWLAQAALVRTLTAVVVNVAEGESPRPHLGFLAPARPFRAAGARGRRIVADPASFASYDHFADAVASIEAGKAASAYRALEPLFDAAYRELGHPEGGFRRGLDRATSILVATPIPPPDAVLVPHAIGFRYADAAFEGLTAAQKQFLRMGPRNVRLVQAKLRELQAALAAGDRPGGGRPANERLEGPAGERSAG